jgi:glucose-6-phosphate isomerase
MKENLGINLKNISAFISEEELESFAQQSARHIDSLNNGTGCGNDFLGWLSLPDDIRPQLDRIDKIARHLRSVSDSTVVIGIGGSYLGARAIIEALSHSFSKYKKTKQHEIFYAGQNIDEDYLSDLTEILNERNFSIIVISKSGTTTEPAIAFRILREQLEKKVGKLKASERIIAITDSKKGALKSLAELNGYETFEIPDNVGGRYSVLSPVGLLPVAVGGFDIKTLLDGAKNMALLTRNNKNTLSNPALLYASARNLLMQKGKSIEIIAGFTQRLHFFSEWWKQLFGESEGKEGKGLYPSSADFSTDLHSFGQYIQEGQRILFETFISVSQPTKKLCVPIDTDDFDKLNYLSGKRLSEINHMAETGTILAHNDGNVPVITVTIPSINEYYIGQLIYFFEMSCAISSYILNVNPFNQPGVEAYKDNMFSLLNKPGYEDSGKRIRERLNKKI